MHPKHLRKPVLLLAILTLLLAFPLAGAAQGDEVLIPIGGGYEDVSLQGFASAVVEHAATPDVIDILVVPATYGTETEFRAENLELAGERTQQIEDACVAVVDEDTHCEATLVPILNHDDALMGENAEQFDDPDLDGIFMLGGDQLIAMEVLADTPSEAAMHDAFERGVVFGGTSAGAAVQSQTMISGYVDTGWPYNALELNQVVIWWTDDVPGEESYMRGISFGADNFFTDQHFYQRGRITRSLSTMAQSDYHFNGESLIGIGFDYSTGASITNAQQISDVFGPSSIMVMDGESGGTEFDWVGPNKTLVAGNIVTQVLAPDADLTYDLITRQAALDGEPVALPDRLDWDGPSIDSDGILMLSGGALDDTEDYQVLSDFASRLGDGTVLIVGVGFKNHGQARKAAKEYRQLMADLGYRGAVDIVDYQPGKNAAERLDNYATGVAGVIFFANDQSVLPAAIEGGLGDYVRDVLAVAPVVLTDDAMTAAMGDEFVANADPTDDNYQDEGIAAFQTDYADVQQGLGIVEGAAFEPWLTYDQRWGRLYGLAYHAAENDETLVPIGISERTALVIEGDDASVVGERSVVVIDGRTGTFAEGDNGAITALNVHLDLYADGSELP